MKYILTHSKIVVFQSASEDRLLRKFEANNWRTNLPLVAQGNAASNAK